MTRGSSAWRTTNWGDPCKPKLREVQLNGATVKVDERAVPAFQALAAVFAKHRYGINPHYPAGDTGSYNCRQVTGGTSYSSHAWGLAVDVNWNKNPYRRDQLVTDIPRALVDDVLALATKGGVQVFRWGGDWDGRPGTPHSNYDAMHFEIVATPSELAAGLAGVAAPKPTTTTTTTTKPSPATPVAPEEDNMLAKNDKGNAVARFQSALLTFGAKRTGDTWVAMRKYGADGDFGGTTEAAVIEYQKAANLTPTGKIDGVTAALLMEYVADHVGSPAGAPAAHSHPVPAHTHVVNGGVAVKGTSPLGNELAKHLTVDAKLGTAGPI